MRFIRVKTNGAALAALFFCILGALALVAKADTAFAKKHLTIQTQAGPVRLVVEIADSNRKRQQGLMFRRALDKRTGMIFLFDQPQEITMWMKNTYISLDMVFIAADWRVVRIETNAEPHSMAIISSVVPASRVLEIPAGEAQRLGLAVGDQVVLEE